MWMVLLSRLYRFISRQQKVYTSCLGRQLFNISILAIWYEMRARKRPKGRSARAVALPPRQHCLICFSMDLKQVGGNIKEDVILVNAFHDGSDTSTPKKSIVLELLVRWRSLLIGRRKQWHVILSIVSVLFGVRVRPLPSSCYMTLKTNNYFSEIKERSTSPRINGVIVCYILYVFLFCFPRWYFNLYAWSGGYWSHLWPYYRLVQETLLKHMSLRIKKYRGLVLFISNIILTCLFL